MENVLPLQCQKTNNIVQQNNKKTIMENNRNNLIKEIEKNVRQMAKKTFIGVGVLYADVIVTCTDGSQWKLDCFFF